MARKKKRTLADLLNEIGVDIDDPIGMRMVGVVYKTDVKGRYVIILDRTASLGPMGWGDEDDE